MARVHSQAPHDLHGLKYTRLHRGKYTVQALCPVRAVGAIVGLSEVRSGGGRGGSGGEEEFYHPRRRRHRGRGGGAAWGAMGEERGKTEGGRRKEKGKNEKL